MSKPGHHPTRLRSTIDFLWSLASIIVMCLSLPSVLSSPVEMDKHVLPLTLKGRWCPYPKREVANDGLAASQSALRVVDD